MAKKSNKTGKTKMLDDQFTTKKKSDDTKDDTFDKDAKAAAEARERVKDILAQRPLNIMQACILQVVTAFLTVVTTFNGYAHYVEMGKLLGHEAPSQEQFLLSRTISIAISLAFAHFFYTGKNWARICFLIYFIMTVGLIGWNFSITSKVYLEHLTNIDSIINLAQLIIAFVVCCLLLTPATRKWFKSLKEASKY